MGSMHPYDLILWLIFVGSTIILGVYIAYYRRYHRNEMKKAAKALKEFHNYKIRYEKLKGPGNPSVTIFQQQQLIGEQQQKLSEYAKLYGDTKIITLVEDTKITKEELTNLGFEKQS